MFSLQRRTHLHPVAAVCALYVVAGRKDGYFGFERLVLAPLFSENDAHLRTKLLLQYSIEKIPQEQTASQTSF